MLGEKKTKKQVVRAQNNEPFLSKEYTSTLAKLKKQIRESQVRAVTAANSELVRL